METIVDFDDYFKIFNESATLIKLGKDFEIGDCKASLQVWFHNSHGYSNHGNCEKVGSPALSVIFVEEINFTSLISN